MGQPVGVFASCLLLLLLMVIHACRAAAGITVVTEHKDHPNKCWDEEGKKAYDIGEHWQSKDCVDYTCHRNKAGLYIGWNSCIKIALPDPTCTFTEDLSLPYPFCCPQPACRGGPQTTLGKSEDLKGDTPAK